MTPSESILFPCPLCGAQRGEVDATCKKCGWAPNTASTPTKPNSQPYSKPVVVVIGFLTLLPLAYLLFFFAMMLSFVTSPGKPNEGLFVLLFVMHFAVIILSWCLIGFYIYFLFTTDHVKQDQKALWAVVLFFANMLVMPVFWYLYIWKPASQA